MIEIDAAKSVAKRETSMGRLRGTIIRILPSKGFCFIRDEHGVSRFAHTTSFEPSIAFDMAREGSAVEFEPVELDGAGGNKMRAKSVVVLEEQK